MNQTAHNCTECGEEIVTDDGEIFECDNCGATYRGHTEDHAYVIEGRVA